MSKIKKKTNKTMRLSVLAASLMMLTPITHSASTHFSPKPLVGVSQEFAPHVVLALSVEFPTAGAAYFSSRDMNVENTATPNAEVTNSYLGYFDNKKCYKYNHDGGYFEPSSMAQNKLCNNGSETNEFSGNMLNYMTMSSIDIFRSAMTGGNRAMGTGSTEKNYTDADTTATYLRRANVVINQNGLSPQRLRERSLKPFWGLNSNTNRKEIMRHLLPHGYVDFAMQDALMGNQQSGNPRSLGYVEWKPVFFRAPKELLNEGQLAGTHDTFVNHDLYFVNDGFTVTLARKVYKYRTVKQADGSLRNEPILYPAVDNAGNPVFDSSGKQTTRVLDYFAVYKPRTHQQYTNSKWKIPNASQWDEKWAKPLNVVVKVCDSSNSLQREANCRQYGNHYKPEGLLQQYAEKGIRVATMGYLNIEGNSVHGGVLRSRMKQLLNDPDKKFQDEWNTATGILNPNPDREDADKTGTLGVPNTITNSGAINYLNKFGDRSGYKGNDPGAELYYTALAYLRGLKGATPSNPNLGNTTAVPYKPGETGQIPMSALTDAAKDGFPTIYDWDDPFTRGVDPSTYQCHQNSIIYIGDTNTHGERELPGFDGRDGSPVDDGIQTKSYLARVLANEPNLLFKINDSIGAGGTSPAGIVGLAYWARVNDIRAEKEIPGVQNGNNFMIDVVETGNYKDGKNSYYLAAKYGGFSRMTQDGTKTTNGNDGSTTDPANKALPDQRWMWTDDAQGISSVQQFADGMPRNFAVANNPDAMVTALEKAMSVGTATGNPTQAGTGLSVNSGDVVDFSLPAKPVVLQSTYNFAQLTGDIIAYDATYDRSADNNSYFTRSEKWRASTGLEQYRTTFATRKLFTIRNNTVYDFRTDSANIFSNVRMLDNTTVAQLNAYVLGSNGDEGRLFRKRSSLMGTVVNSTVMPIVKVGDNAPDPSQCTYANDKVRSRPIHYAAAANDGILHIVDGSGQPVAGYMAGVAVDKLPDFANRNYTHQYLNDGTPVVAEVCMGQGEGKAKSILLGTTGRGGAAVYALDVTDMSNFSKSNVLWEFSVNDDPDLGYTVSKPVITKSPDGRPLAIVSSGYNNTTNKGHIFILDISKPNGAWVQDRNYWKIPLGGSGVGAPFAYDKDNDGVADKIFVGDLDGKLWQLNRNEGNSGVSWSNPYGTAPLFTPNTVAGSNPPPITGAPYVDTAGGKLMVVVGTGKYFTEDDLNKTQQNYAYGFIVNDQTTITEAELLQQQIISTPVTGDNVKLNSTKTALYSVTENAMTDQHKGWRLQLLQGQLIAANALIRSKQAAEFSAVRLTDGVSMQCQRSGATSYISVDVTSGGLHKRPIFDSNNDGKVDSSDAHAAMYEALGVIAPNVVTMNVSSPNGDSHLLADINDGGGGTGTTDTSQHILLGSFDAVKGVRRISWREIF